MSGSITTPLDQSVLPLQGDLKMTQNQSFNKAAISFIRLFHSKLSG